MTSQLEFDHFREVIFNHYLASGRTFPWRNTTDPYAILVSEIMLQQTQTERVVPKYEAFLTAFPTLPALAQAKVTEVLHLWQGLGYNRRGLALQRAAEEIVRNYDGKVPNSVEELVTLPGIGPYTAGAILAFAFNQPVPLIETNIRRVYLHHFFQDKEGIADKELFPLIEATMDQKNPREWYYALMDYGAWLTKQVPNPNRRSKHYTKQAAFTGSQRQLRGALLRLHLENPAITVEELIRHTGASPEKVQAVREALIAEGFPLNERSKAR
jgi:A/G-specific adenine glycosylase